VGGFTVFDDQISPGPLREISTRLISAFQAGSRESHFSPIYRFLGSRINPTFTKWKFLAGKWKFLPSFAQNLPMYCYFGIAG
jgi:hypothetical protein